ncbi:hypothetical protein A4U53_003720 (plasmid) [Rhizobium ruizarguesonis]|uniref:AtuA-like ferredoxin-fold domain-containing protein n=2 Tax=Rhizobium TaxID=379 RepID=A0A179C0Q4_RHILE|nr:hypothetical protein A4U53_36430 [Rhizobium leguminosarum]
MSDALAGGVVSSLAVDVHGKSLGSAILSLEIPEPSRTAAKIGDLSDVRLHNSGHLFQICGEQGGKGEEQPMLPPAISERYLIALADLA